MGVASLPSDLTLWGRRTRWRVENWTDTPDTSDTSAGLTTVRPAGLRPVVFSSVL